MRSTSSTTEPARRFLALAVVALLPLLARAAADRVADASSGQAPEPGDYTLFPLDDQTIPWRDNLKLTLQRPGKFPGGPVLRAGPAAGPDGYGAMLYGTVLKQDGRFRMWYLASPRTDSRLDHDYERLQFARPVAYAESQDGIHWDRPDLGLVAFRGNQHNNLVGIEPAGAAYAVAHDFIAVFYEPGDRPDRRYKMAYIHDGPSEGPSTATAVSPDGLRWKLVNTTSFTQGHFENTSLIKFDGLYYLAGQDHPPYDGSLADGSFAGRVMKVFFSPDFSHWSSGRALAFYRSDYVPSAWHVGQEMHMGAGLWSRGNVILGFYGRWRGDTILAPPDPRGRLTVDSLKGLKVELGLLVSNDAIHYREPVRNFVMVPHGQPSDWDSEAVLQANAFANTATETYIWYSHWNTSNPSHIPGLPARLSASLAQKAPAVGLLTLPRDRFGYFSKLLPASAERNPADNVKRDASCLTRSFALSRPSGLFVNLDQVSPAAPLTLALVDDAERPLPGYTATLAASGLKTPVRWDGGQRDLPTAEAFRVKVSWPVGVDSAQLYALYIEHR